MPVERDYATTSAPPRTPTIPIANAPTLEQARQRRLDGKKGKAIMRFTREFFPTLFWNGGYQMSNGFPRDATIVHLEYNHLLDYYEILIESTELPIVAEGTPIPYIYPKITRLGESEEKTSNTFPRRGFI